MAKQPHWSQDLASLGLTQDGTDDLLVDEALCNLMHEREWNWQDPVPGPNGCHCSCVPGDAENRRPWRQCAICWDRTYRQRCEGQEAADLFGDVAVESGLIPRDALLALPPADLHLILHNLERAVVVPTKESVAEAWNNAERAVAAWRGARLAAGAYAELIIRRTPPADRLSHMGESDLRDINEMRTAATHLGEVQVELLWAVVVAIAEARDEEADLSAGGRRNVRRARWLGPLASVLRTHAGMSRPQIRDLIYESLKWRVSPCPIFAAHYRDLGGKALEKAIENDENDWDAQCEERRLADLKAGTIRRRLPKTALSRSC